MQQKTRTRIPGKNVGLPSKTCTEDTCPFHGSLKVRGKSFTGIVVSDKMQKSVVVSWDGRQFVPKFERYKKTRTRVSAHNPDCVLAKEGDVVVIQECRPISKTKSFVVLQVLGQENDYILTKSLGEEGKHKLKKKEIANIDSQKSDSESEETDGSQK